MKFVLLLFSVLVANAKKYLVHDTDLELPDEAKYPPRHLVPEFDMEALEEFYIYREHPLFEKDFKYYTCNHGCESVDQLMIDYGRLVTIENMTERLERAEEAEEIKAKIQQMYPKFGTPEYEPEERTSFHKTLKWF